MPQDVPRLSGLDFRTLTFAYEGSDQPLVGVTLAYALNEVLV